MLSEIKLEDSLLNEATVLFDTDHVQQKSVASKSMSAAISRQINNLCLLWKVGCLKKFDRIQINFKVMFHYLVLPLFEWLRAVFTQQAWYMGGNRPNRNG
jgi:hypothetical protein